MKKFLYIAYYWPPCGGIMVVRNLKFVKYMREFGWEPVIFSPENANYPVTDKTTFKDLPEGIEIIKQPVIEPFGVFNLLQGKKKDEKVKDVFLIRDKEPGIIHKIGIWVRGNFFIPDARMLWIKPSVKKIKKYLENNKIDAIISYGPPHTCHRIAYHIHKDCNIPWIADFQDPWTQIDYFEKFQLKDFARNKHKKQEQEVLKTADKVVMVSKAWVKDLAELADREVEYIPFGFDEDDFKKASKVETDKFVISHFGTLGTDRNPHELWKVLSEIGKEQPNFLNNLQIVLAGNTDFSVFEEIEENGLKQNLMYFDFLTKDKVMGWMLESNILLLLLNKGFGDYNVLGRIPAKLFEYLGSRRQLLVIGQSDSDVANIVRECTAGITINYDECIELKSTVLKMYEAWQKGKQVYKSSNIENFSFKNLTSQMARLLNAILKN